MSGEDRVRMYNFALGLFIFLSHARCPMYLRIVSRRDDREVERA